MFGADVGELETVLLAFLAVIVDDQSHAGKLAPLELPQILAKAVLGALLGKVAKPGEGVRVLVRLDECVNLGLADPFVGMAFVAREEQRAHRLSLAVGGQSAIILVWQAWIAQIVQGHDAAHHTAPLGEAVEGAFAGGTPSLNPQADQGVDG